VNDQIARAAFVFAAGGAQLHRFVMRPPVLVKSVHHELTRGPRRDAAASFLPKSQGTSPVRTRRA
jgi:hypothetical protein